MQKLIISFLVFSLSMMSCQIFSASMPANNASSIQAMFEPLLKLQQEGKLDGTVLIARGSKEVFMLDNSGDSLDPCQGLRGQYYLGSTGKQMIAVALLKAIYDHAEGNSEEIRVEQAKLQLNKPLLHFLPANGKIWRDKVPEWANKVTLHQLLTHQSGIPDFTRFPAFSEKNAAGEQFEESPHETWEFLKIIEGQPLDFEPGTSESYSNTGYTLIKEVIRAVVNMPAEDYMNHNLFQPLGMNDTWALKEGTWQALSEKKHTSCLLKPLRYDPISKSQNVYPQQNLADAGGSGPIQIVSTAIDILKWNLGLHKDHCCLPSALYGLAIAPHSKGPSGFGYGYGIARDKTRFGIALNHSSGSARIIYVPSEELSLILLTHVSYDWDRVEGIIQARMKELEASSKNKQEAEQQAVKEVLERYPCENRGSEAISSLFNKFLGIQ